MEGAAVMEPTARVAVTVTFLRMDVPPQWPAPPLLADASLVAVTAPTVAFYRFLYDTVGADYLWWLRRTVPDADIAAMLADPRVTLHVLYRGGQPAGFFEIDARSGSDANLSYFGLMPHAVGHGFGMAFLRAAIDAAWAVTRRGVTVNTCTADHPRALPGYVRAGFRPVRQARETWHVPLSLGLRIPDALRV
jgi:GNAT superfamily N-acetyltransferase